MDTLNYREVPGKKDAKKTASNRSIAVRRRNIWNRLKQH
jgi:hypothetical protein